MTLMTLAFHVRFGSLYPTGWDPMSWRISSSSGRLGVLLLPGNRIIVDATLAQNRGDESPYRFKAPHLGSYPSTPSYPTTPTHATIVLVLQLWEHLD